MHKRHTCDVVIRKEGSFWTVWFWYPNRYKYIAVWSGPSHKAAVDFVFK